MISIVIPVYNEKENIEAILTYVLTMEGDFHVLVVEDNLVKGASGQGVQCLNIMFGFPESMGLEQIALMP